MLGFRLEEQAAVDSGNIPVGSGRVNAVLREISLDDDRHLLPDLQLPLREGNALLELHELAAAAFFRRVVNLPGKFGRRSAVLAGIGENPQPVKTHLPDKFKVFPMILLGLAREARDQRRPEHDIRHLLSNRPDDPDKILPGRTAVHLP